jgi:type VI secretion system protein ImpJ
MQIGVHFFMATHNINRVVWTDGLLVEAQHFQQQERYIEHQVNSRLSQITNLGWGFSELEIDQDLLQQGLLAIIRARGIFDDGTPFSIPTCDAIL